MVIIVPFFFPNEIKLCFLMVEHMDEDIDQMFSCISRHISKLNILTFGADPRDWLQLLSIHQCFTSY